jgi:hypothetical protein
LHPICLIILMATAQELSVYLETLDIPLWPH